MTCKKCVQNKKDSSVQHEKSCQFRNRSILIACKFCKKEKEIETREFQKIPEQCFDCYRKNRKGNSNPNWKGGRNKRKDGYILLTKLSKKEEKRLEHRVKMEERIGRKLKKKEIVHHVDQNPSNNALENLILFRHHSAHARVHAFAKRHNLTTKSLSFTQVWLEG